MDLYDLLEKHAKEHLISHRYRDTYMTYEELNTKSDAIAAYLIESFDDSKVPIIVFGHKEHLMLVCFLACIKSGHAYIPVDSSMPSERLKDIAGDSEAQLIFNLSENKLSLDNIDIKNCNNIYEIIENHINRTPDKRYRVTGEDIHYIIYTSGSTGKPKGVKITSNCLKSFIDWAVTLLSTSNFKQHVFMNQAPFSFDLSVMDLYLSLYTGSTIFSVDSQMISSMKDLFSHFERSNISVWVSTPSFAEMCLADSSFNSGLLPKLKTMLFCGETLTNSCVFKLHERFKDIKIINLYGPTEATVAVTAVEITPTVCQEISPLPVGYVKDDCKLFIIEEDKKLTGNNENHLEFNGVSYRILNDGEKGEIIISGKGVSPGYFNNEKISRKVFSTKMVNGTETRYYKTGDEGYIKDNLLYYCGRIDFQVKLNGFRIELDDIENNLREIEFIESAVVLPIRKEEKLQYLTAVVTLNRVFPKKDFQIALTIKEHLKTQIPHYMIPRKIIIKEKLPMTVNGKINRKLLAEELK